MCFFLNMFMIYHNIIMYIYIHSLHSLSMTLLQLKPPTPRHFATAVPALCKNGFNLRNVINGDDVYPCLFKRCQFHVQLMFLDKPWTVGVFLVLVVQSCLRTFAPCWCSCCSSACCGREGKMPTEVLGRGSNCDLETIWPSQLPCQSSKLWEHSPNLSKQFLIMMTTWGIFLKANAAGWRMLSLHLGVWYPTYGPQKLLGIQVT